MSVTANMSEPRVKRIKTCLPLCKTHISSARSLARQNFPTVVEESLCGVSTLLLEVSYRLEALARVFEQSDLALPKCLCTFIRGNAAVSVPARTKILQEEHPANSPV